MTERLPAALDHARQVADAILYEGYLLYPYRASAQKNQQRFQFGVLMPPGYAQVDPGEPAASQTECILEGKAATELAATVRFLQLQRRTVLAAPGWAEVSSLRVGGTEYVPWDEAAEREQQVTAPVSELLSGGAEVPFTVPGGVDEEDLAGPDGQLAGRLVRRRETLSGVIRLTAERLPGPYGALRVRLAVANRTERQPGPLTRRADGLPFALVAAHSLISVPGGRFLSMTDPPEWAAPAVSGCVNTGTWPVLGGPAGCAELILSSPVILYDHPEIAAESAGQLYDSTEIDEILTLRTLALTDAEKQEARATDPRAAELMDRLDDLPPEMLERMHGAIRYLRPAGYGHRPGHRGGPRAGLAAAGQMQRSPGRRRGGTRARTGRCPRRPTTWSSRVSGWPGAAGCGCARAAAGPTRRTSSWPAGPRWSKRCCSTWTARCTWRCCRTTTPPPTCSAVTAGSCTSARTRWSPSRPRANSNPAIWQRRDQDDRQARQGRGGGRASRDAHPVAARNQALSRTARDVALAPGSVPLRERAR